MSEVKKIATRESYGKALAALGAEHEDLIVLDADLAGATKTATFQKAFPERFIDCGIAEGNMIGVAAGLAATGKVPFASSFAIGSAWMPCLKAKYVGTIETVLPSASITSETI